MMDDKMFNELIESVEQAGAIRRGETEPSRQYVYSAIDVKAIREATGRTQEAFAQMIGTSLSTVRSWEQGKRQPTGPAKALLTIFQSDPVAASRLLHKVAV
ncbi:MAG: NadS family protein [Amphritea sp.]